ncbi:hypothetical protein BASA50_005572 [Batrachochytrium salamandrivorans]|uniref:E3 ubiquitin-protein ligase n=1 Tax=Batrachochytrium salamandrivorans TaxID=1357716 RepID=A0ABQ8FCF4_9FUNG|nr:hypothetical protein BASA50_005572 [Batrachochytrium salamandrivorans]
MAYLDYDEVEQEYLQMQIRMAELPPAHAQVPLGANPQLYTFLHYAPFMYDLKLPLTGAVRKTILAVVWYHMSMGSRSVFEDLVGSPSSIVVPTDDDTAGRQGLDTPSDDEDHLPLEYQPSQRGKACGHVFDRGEGIYRCRTCALDDTCVFCVRCYDATTHEGHDTTMSIAVGSGGCCDCGDPEAWRIPIVCKYHSIDTTDSQSLDGLADHDSDLDHTTTTEPDLAKASTPASNAFRETIITLLEFAICNLSKSSENPRFTGDVDVIQSRHPPDVVMGEDRTMYFSCILWNDESHSFQEVIDQVTEATNCTDAFARNVAVTVDKRGRFPIRTSDSLQLLVAVASIISKISLTVSIRPTRDIFREEIAGVLINWLKTVCRFVLSSQTVNGVKSESVEQLVRTIICEELCNPLLTDLEEFNSASPLISELSTPSNLTATRAQRSRIHYFLTLDSRLWKDVRNSLRELYIGTLIVSGDVFKKSMAIHFVNSYLEVSRCYLFHDREIDLSIMNFTVQIFTVPSIANYLIHHTLLLPYMFSLLKAHFLSDVLPDEYPLKTKYYDAIQKAKVDFRPIYPTLRFDGEAVRNKRHAHLLFDARYVLSSHNVRNGGSVNNVLVASSPDGSASVLLRFLDLCLVWQGINPQIRSLHNHIEYETDDWLHAFNHSINILQVVRSFANCFDSVSSDTAAATLLNAMSETRDTLLKWTLHRHVEYTKSWQTMQISIAGVMRRRATVRDGFHLVTLVQGHPCRVPDFHVAFQPISFHKCLHWLLASFVKNNAVLLQHTTDHKKRLAIVHAVFDIAVESPSVSVESSLADSTHILDLHEMARILSVEDRMALIFDFPLRSIVFASQIKSGVWVRNGYNIREQAKHYKDAVMREAYDHDMLLLQYAAVCLGPDKLLSMLVDRYGLVSWFQGHTVSQDTSHYESSQILSFVQDLLQVIIIVLTERSSAAAVSPTDELRREMIHYLAVHRSGTAYSELSRRVADSLMDAAADSAGTMNDRNTLVASAASFDALLSSVAHFKFPDGASDHGLYELKDEMYAQVDQWFWHYTSNEREDLNDVLRKRLEKKRALSRQGGREASFEDEAVRRPKLLKIEPCTGFDRLSSVIHSPIFNQILFYSLWNVTRTAAESGQEPASNETILSEAIHLLVVSFEILEMEEDSVNSGVVGHTPHDTGFIHHAISSRLLIPVRKGAATRPTTLLELILSLVDRANEDDIKEQAPRLRYLVQRFEAIGGPVVTLTLSGWRDKSHWDLGKPVLPGSGSIEKQSGLSGSSEALTELEQRKLAAKTRQANIMAQFAQAQQSFMANFGDDMDDMDDAEDQSDFEDRDEAAHSGKDTLDRPDHRAWRFATGTCIVCQEDAVAGGKMYGMLCLLRHTTVRRQILFSDAANVAKVLAASPSSFDVESDPAVKIDSKGVHCYNNASGKRPMDPAVAHTGLGASSSSTGATTSPSQTLPFSGSSSQPCPLKRVSFEGVTATSCGHLMHFSCFNTYTNSITARQLSQPTRNHPEDQDANEFMCPLCKSLGNAVLPVVWSSRHETVNWRGSDVPERGTGDANDRQLLGSLRLWLVDSGFMHVKNSQDTEMESKSSFSDGHTGGPLIDASRTISDLGAEVALDELETSGMSSTSVMSLTDSLTQAFVDHTALAPAALTFKSSSDTARLHELHVIYTRNVYNALNGLFEGGGVSESTGSLPFKTDMGVEMLTSTRMCELLATTIASLDILGRASPTSWTPGVPRAALADSLLNVGVLDTMSSQMLMCLRILSEAALGATFYTKCTQTALVEFGDRYLTSFFGDHGIKGLYPKPLEEDPSHVHPPVLLRDGFSHLVVLSMSVIPARVATRSKDESEVFQWIRVLWIFELVRCVVSVVESILLYGDAWIMDPRVLSAAAAAASSHPVRSVYSDDPASIRESNPEAGQSTRSSEPEHTDGGDNDDDELKYGGLCHLIRVVLSEMKLMPDARTYVHKSIRADIVLALFERTGLVFVRRCAVLLYARFGLVPPGGISGFGFDLVQPDQDHVGGLESDRGFNAAACLGGSELERLCKYLDLPSAATLASLPIIHDRVFGHMVLHWVHDFGRSMANHFGVVWSTEAPRRLERERQRAAGATRTLLSSISTDVLAPPSAPHVSLDLPLVFELANLPLRLATLFEESRRKVCKRCGTIPLDPALCVLCGMILCSQSYCCSDEDHGECNQHIQECGGSIGIFLLIKQAMMILLLPNGKGTFMDLPYLDAHGEVDPQLRRGRPLFLNRKRYAEIRKLWLTHGVPSYIARKIDQAFDSGGWSTF